MANSISFYATPSELNDWVHQWAISFSFHVVGFSYFPPTRVLLPASRPSEPIDTSAYDEVILLFDLDSAKSFLADPKSSEYPAGFRIAVPDMTSDGLRTGILNLIRVKPIKQGIWKALVADVTKHTTAGMWVHGTFSGLSGFDNELRYTQRIADLTKQGLKLLPFAGGNPVSIDEPTPVTRKDARAT